MILIGRNPVPGIEGLGLEGRLIPTRNLWGSSLEPRIGDTEAVHIFIPVPAPSVEHSRVGDSELDIRIHYLFRSLLMRTLSHHDFRASSIVGCGSPIRHAIPQAQSVAQ